MRRAALPPLLGLLFAAACQGGSSGPTAIEIPVARIELVNGCSGVAMGETCQILARAFTDDGRQIGNPVLRWSSSNSAVADVSETGRVTARSPGQAMVTVTNTTGSVSERVTVRVVEPQPK